MAKSDEALMFQLQTGDLRSFDTLVKRWEKPLLNYCYRMVNDITLAKDLRQEIFLRIYRLCQNLPSNGEILHMGYIELRKISVWIPLPNKSTEKRYR